MRWSEQTIEAEQRTRLPGYRDEAVVRHFEAPDAVPTRFYEIRAKSILNRVPEASQMPFRWTINPYRGCSHACAYCLWGGTPVLLADGRPAPIESLRVGDEIYGTGRDPSRVRRYVRATVLDRWITVKPAFRVVLRDETELILSGDHRLLTDRGWKHVLDTTGGVSRPHLTTANSLVGTGAFASPPVVDEDYRRGYLTGIIRGDGHVGSYHHPRRRAGGGCDVHLFRLALADAEALERSRGYLAQFGIDTRERVLARATDRHRRMDSIYSGRKSVVHRVIELIRWPPGTGSLSWSKGYLAGIFDAEGSRSAFALRITNADAEVLGRIESCARRLGFDACRDRPHVNGVTSIRIRGGLAEHLRFFHITDPAITRKRSIERQMVKTFADLQVVAIEPLGRDLPLYDITTSTGDFIADGVVSHNCFARPTHTYLDFDAGRDFEREIVVKVNAPERLRAELGRPRWRGEHVALGTNTDPYQWVEGRYRLMRGIWQAFIDARNPASVLTKSPLLLRDLDLMSELHRRAGFRAALSVPTIDEAAWRASEPHTPSPRARLEAVARLTAAGIPTGVLVAPLMPGINDDPEQVREILRLCAEAGAEYVSGIALHLRGDVRRVFMEWLAGHRPDLVPRYRELYRRGAYAPMPERRRLAALLDGPELSPAQRARDTWRMPPPAPPERAPTPPATPAQERLFDG